LQVARDIENNNIKVTYNAEDNGSTYSYYVEAYDENDASILLATSNQRTETVTTGTKGYYYIVDTDRNNSDFDIKNAIYTEDENIGLDVSNNGKYIHMKAIDVAGNVGAPSVKKIEVKSTLTIKLDGGVLNGNTEDTTREEAAGTVIELGQPTKEGFTFEGWEPVEGAVNGNNYTFPIRDDEVVAQWRRNNYGYRVEYYYNDLIDNNATVTGEAAFESELNSYEPKAKTGYKFDRVETLPLKITTNPLSNVIRVYYVTDDSQKKTLNYSVEYYKGNDKVEADTQHVNQQVQYLAPDVLTVDKTKINTTDKYVGYRLDQIRVNDKLVSEIPERVDNNDIIKVFYVKRNDLRYVVKHFDVETKEEIHEAQIFERQTFEDVINGEEKAIEIDGYTFGHTDPRELVIGVDESKNVINVYYSKVTGLSYTVNYLEKGTNKVVYPARTVDGQTFGNVILASSEKITVDGYNYDSVSAESITIGSDSSKNIINIYYTKKNDLSYTVNYIEKGTTREIAESKTVNNVTFGTEIVSSSEAISIPGFNYDSAEKTSIIIGTGDNVINLYYTRRDNLTYKVKYMEKDTTNEIAAEKNVLNAVFGTTVTASAERIEIAGYVYNSADKDVMTVGVDETENVLTLYYTRRTDLSYSVNYLDEATGEAIHEITTKGNQVLGTVINAEDEKIEIAGYNYKTVNPASITIGTDLSKNIINVYYTKRNDLTYIVNYYEENTTTKVAESKTVNGQTYLAKITENAIEVSGYNKVDPTTKTITIGVEGNVINFYYTKKNDLSYVVNYYEENTTNKIADSKVVTNQKYKDEIIEEAINIAGYNKVEPTTKTITIGTEENIINFYYTKRTDLSYVVNYYEENTTTKVAESKTVNGQTYLSSVTENAIDVVGYDKVNPTNKTIVIGVEGNEINFYYTKRNDLSYRVNYLEKDTNKVVAEAKVVEGQEFKAEITERAIDVNGYDKVAPTIQSITIGVEENIINFYYTKKNNLSYKVNYLDSETGDVLQTQKVVNNKTFGEKITSSEEIIDIDGYEFETVDKQSITIGTGENVINIYYTRRSDLSYTMNFLEKDTNEVLAEPVIVRNQAFEAVVSSNNKAIEIEGYNYDSVDKKTLTVGTGVN
ncbi:hypothetical protein, partial [uncultured Alistipes sp.]|uniref:hypothetical protein n=1 Tax=uncultured Alistipes sp. TaxID=538949 RepID=UPI0032205FE0